MTERPGYTRTFIEIAYVMAQRSTCARRKVGCVLVNEKNQVLATGYNGVASGQTHCTDHACPGAHLPSGEGLDKCEAIHAEANALLQCKNVYEIHTAYVTASPCIHCVKLLMNTSCKRIVFVEDYPGSEKVRELWGDNREWLKVSAGWSNSLKPVTISASTV